MKALVKKENSISMYTGSYKLWFGCLVKVVG